MPRICTLLALLCALSSNSFAATYRGTITQTIPPFTDTSGWLGEYESGATYVGYYQYESPTIDGTFVTAGWSIEGNKTLQGSVYQPFPNNPPYGKGGWNLLTGTSKGGKMTVVGGVVTNFGWHYEWKGFLSEFGTEGFSSIVYNDFGFFYPDLPEEEWPRSIGIEGSLEFSTPTQVPDTAGTLGLLSISMLGLVICRRRFAS